METNNTYYYMTNSIAINRMVAYFNIAKMFFTYFYKKKIDIYVDIGIVDKTSLENATKFLDATGLTFRTLLEFNCKNDRSLYNIASILSSYIDRSNGKLSHISVSKVLESDDFTCGDFKIKVNFEELETGTLRTLILRMPSYYHIEKMNQCELVGDSLEMEQMMTMAGFNMIPEPYKMHSDKFHTFVTFGQDMFPQQ